MTVDEPQRRPLRWAPIGLVLVAVLSIGALYLRELKAARERTERGGRTITTACGPVEYAELGAGQPVLIIHGAGGGYDQGLTAGRVAVDGAYRVIAPSRFGYLNSPVPKDPSPAAQADTYACLLDALGIDQAAVLAVSAGGPSAIEFAVRYPERVRGLILYSAISYQETPSPAEAQREATINRIVGSDLVYWLAIHSARTKLLELFGVSRQVQANLPEDEQAILDQTLEEMLPMSKRIRGIALDQRAALPRDFPLQDIVAPTLVLHARDDTLVPFDRGQHSAEGIPGAQLVAFDQGGHFLAGHSNEIKMRIREFLDGLGLAPGPIACPSAGLSRGTI